MHLIPRTRIRFAATVVLAVACGAAIAETTVIERPGRGTNRIEVTGNTADGSVRTDCAQPRAEPAPATNVNSVNISGQALQGRTVIVTGGGKAPCPQRDAAGNRNVNSVTIR